MLIVPKKGQTSELTSLQACNLNAFNNSSFVLFKIGTCDQSLVLQLGQFLNSIVCSIRRNFWAGVLMNPLEVFDRSIPGTYYKRIFCYTKLPAMIQIYHSGQNDQCSNEDSEPKEPPSHIALICEIYFCIRTLNLTFNQIILVKMEPGPKDFYFPSIDPPRCTYPFFRLFWSIASKFSANIRAINSTGNIPFNITREFPCA
jgi:hypothetical protein